MLTTPTTSTFTPFELMRGPSASALRDEFVGRSLSELRTPALIVDRDVFEQNCKEMDAKVEKLGMRFRAHIKSESTGWLGVRVRGGEGRRMRRGEGEIRQKRGSIPPHHPPQPRL